VVDEALALWQAREQQRAMEAQFQGEGAPEEEWERWREVRARAAIDT
jgi:hypothetical protein